MSSRAWPIQRASHRARLRPRPASASASAALLRGLAARCTGRRRAAPAAGARDGVGSRPTGGPRWRPAPAVRSSSPGKVSIENLGRRAAGRREVHRADDAHADTVAGAVAFEAVPVTAALEFERRALDVLPAERSADDRPQVLAGDLRRASSPPTRSLATRPEHVSATGCGSRAAARRGSPRRAGRAPDPRRRARPSSRRSPCTHRRAATAGTADPRGPARPPTGSRSGRRTMPSRRSAPARRAAAAPGRPWPSAARSCAGVARSHHLAVRLVAQVEAVGVVPAAVRHRERPDRDGQRFERGRPALARRFAGQHARDVGFEREGSAPCTRRRARDPDAHLRAEISCACVDDDEHRHRGTEEHREPPIWYLCDLRASADCVHGSCRDPRNGTMPSQIRGRLAVS